MGSKSNIHSKFLSVKLPITRSVALSRNSRAVDGQFGIIPGPKSGCRKLEVPVRAYRLPQDGQIEDKGILPYVSDYEISANITEPRGGVSHS
jgi:hypothetical protein